MRALVDLPRGGLQLLPFYARVAATVSQVFPDVAKGALLSRFNAVQRFFFSFLSFMARVRYDPPGSTDLRCVMDALIGNINNINKLNNHAYK